MILNVLVVLVLVLANGFFVASEFALVKVREGELKALADRGSQKAKRVQSILQNLDTYLSSCQLGITLASLGLGWVGEPMVARSLSPLLRMLEVPERWDHFVAFPIAFVTITFLHITLGEQVPKIFAISKHNPVSLQIAHPLYWFTVTLKPFIFLLNSISNAMLRIIGFDTNDLHGQSTTEAELRVLLRESEEGGHVTKREHTMIENVLDLENKVARRYAVPRHQVVFLDANDPVDANLRLAAESEHTRIPLCRGKLEECLGVIHVKDIFQRMAAGEKIEDFSGARPSGQCPAGEDASGSTPDSFQGKPAAPGPARGRVWQHFRHDHSGERPRGSRRFNPG